MGGEPTTPHANVLRPHGAVAARAVCPGDPGRALRIAQDLSDGVPRMLNHHRGLWGYAADALDGEPLTVQATGMGGPSAAAVVGDLAALGARRLVRVGTATALDPTVRPGELVAVTRALAGDGAGRALLGGAPAVAPDAALAAALGATADRAGAVASTDLLRAPDADGLVWDLQTAALLAAAAAAGVRAAAVLVVLAAGGERLGEEALLAAELRAGRLALAALG